MATPHERDSAPPVNVRRLFGLARGHVSGLLLATLMMLVGSAIGLATPQVAGRVVDAALVDGDPARLNAIVLALISLFAALGAAAFLEHWLIRRTGARLLLELRARLFDHLLTLSPGFYSSRPTGVLLSRLGTDLTMVQGALMGFLPEAPFSLDNFRSLKTDNVCQHNSVGEFGISPASIEAVVPQYLGSTTRQRRMKSIRSRSRH